MWSALNISAYGGYMPAPSGYISAHRICDPLDGKSKEVISSSQSQSLVEWVFVAKTSWLRPAAVAAFLRLLLSLEGLGQLDISWASQPHRLHCCTVMQPETGSDSYSVVTAVSCRKRYVLEVIGEVGWGKNGFSCTVLTLCGSASQSHWPCLLALLALYRKDTAAGFLTTINGFVFHYKFLMERRQQLS